MSTTIATPRTRGNGLTELACTAASDLEDAVDALVHRSPAERRASARQCRRHQHHRLVAVSEVTDGPLDLEGLRLVHALSDVGDLTETLSRVCASRGRPQLAVALRRDLLELRHVGAALLREVGSGSCDHALRSLQVRGILGRVLGHRDAQPERELWLASVELTRSLLAVADAVPVGRR